jgi:hypothetical protein
VITSLERDVKLKLERQAECLCSTL